MKTLFVLVKCAPSQTEAVGNALETLGDGNWEVYSITGKYDLLIKIRVGSVDEIQTIVQEQIQVNPHIRDTYTFFSFRMYGDFSVF